MRKIATLRRFAGSAGWGVEYGSDHFGLGVWSPMDGHYTPPVPQMPEQSRVAWPAAPMYSPAMAYKAPRPRVEVSSRSAVRVPRKKLAELVAFVAKAERRSIAETDLAVVDSKQIEALNRRYLRRTGPTDVLSFDLSEPGDKRIRAQLVVCGDIAARHARSAGCGVQRELMLYVIHGLLHLLGYDDRSKSAAARMHTREQEILDAFNMRQRKR